MRSAGLIALVLVALAGCAKPETALDKAERHYRFLKGNGGSIAELCTAAQEGKAAAVDAGDKLQYLTWDGRVLGHCRLEQR